MPVLLTKPLNLNDFFMNSFVSKELQNKLSEILIKLTLLQRNSKKVLFPTMRSICYQDYTNQSGQTLFLL